MKVTATSLYHAFTRLMDGLGDASSVDLLSSSIERGYSLCRQYDREPDKADHLSQRMWDKLLYLEEICLPSAEQLEQSKLEQEL